MPLRFRRLAGSSLSNRKLRPATVRAGIEGPPPRTTQCPNCHGKGTVNGHKCATCDGKGWIKAE